MNTPDKKPVAPLPVPPPEPVYARVTGNQSTNALFPASALLLSIPIVTSGGSLEVLVTASATAVGLTSVGTFFVRIDGVDVKGCGEQMATVRPSTVALLIGPPDLAAVGLSPLAPGAHTVELRWAGNVGGAATVQILAGTAPLQQHGTMRVQEV